MALLFTMFLALAAMIPASGQTIPIEGNAASPVRVVIYEDLQCPDCAVFREMLDKTLLPQFGSKVAFEHRDFPLAKHAFARKEAIAARYFAQVSPEISVEFRRTMFAHIAEVKAGQFTQLLTAFARDHGVDPEKALAALVDAKLAAAVQSDFEDGVARGIAHTPTVFVNGEPFIESFPVEDVAKSIERALARASASK
jgi:protein-disulfide isomerase